MWGFAADTVAGHLCRFYASALGEFPPPCLTNGGTPALAMTLIVLLTAAIAVGLLRARARSARDSGRS